jgi:phosphoribosylglycinamide formyltransferase 2
MQIGTPLSPSATRVMVLGSGELGKELIIALQRFGVETIAVDRYANAPGHQVAHRAHVIAMTDAAALKRLIEQERPQIIVPELEAIATDVLTAFEQNGTVQIIPNARATALTTNREWLRRLATETLDLHTSAYRFAASQQELSAAILGNGKSKGIGFPCVIKPIISSSGKGQSIVRAKNEIPSAWQYAESAGRAPDGRIIVEEYIPFDYEITLLTVRTATQNGTIETHFCEPIGHVAVNGDYVESWQPQPMSDVALAKAHEIAGRITANLGGRGIFGVELFVRGDDVWFSEVSPRPHGTGMVTMCTQPQNQFELHARAFLGLPISTRIAAAGASAVIYGQLDARGVRFDNVAEALSVPDSDLRLFGKPDAYKRRRMGVALATGRDIGQARDRARQCASRVTPHAA